MGGKYNCLIFIYFLMFMVQGQSAVAFAQQPQGTGFPLKKLNIPVAVYILDSSDDNRLSSRRSISSMEDHFDEVNTIWSQADIAIDPILIKRLNVPHKLIRALTHRTGRGGIQEFFRGIRQGQVDFGTMDQNALVWIFYVRTLGGPNGMMPIATNTLFVADVTTVKDARVTSHEIGHVLGLYHARTDINRLLFSGANGVLLTDREKSVARYNAKKLLDQ